MLSLSAPFMLSCLSLIMQMFSFFPFYCRGVTAELVKVTHDASQESRAVVLILVTGVSSLPSEIFIYYEPQKEEQRMKRETAMMRMKLKGQFSDGASYAHV